MLEKAKNRKIFYFFLFIILGINLFISPSIAATYTIYRTNSCTINDIVSGGEYLSWYFTDTDGSSISSPIPNYFGVDIGSSATVLNEFTILSRGVLEFNTSSVLESNIESIYLNAYVSSYQDNGDFGDLDIVFTGFSPASPILTVSDYNNFDTNNYGEIDISDNKATGWKNISIDTSWFSNEDKIYLGLRLDCDISQTPEAFSYNKRSYYTFDYLTGPPDKRAYLVINTEDKNCDIDVSPTSGASPLAVSFTDKSSGFTEGVDLVYLDYGDGNSYSGTYPGYDSTRNYIYLDAGTYNYSYRITNDGNNYYSNGTVTVTGDSTVNFQVIVRGLNGAYIGDATVNIWYDSGTMIDSDITDDFYGSADFYVNPSRYVNGNVTKDGYYTSNFTYYVCPTGYCSNEVWITLYTVNETPGSGDEFGNYLVTFKNANSGVPVPYSNIEVYSDSGYTTLYYDEYSNLDGVWTGLVPMNIDLYYKYPETTSYYSQSWSYNLTSSPAYKTVNLIPKSGATSTATLTPTTTITIITPTVTYTYNDSNLSALNVKEKFTNLLVLAGFQNAESADLIFAMIIVLGCTALIGWITLSGSGAGMGAIIGFVFSLGLGLIPLWLLISAVFLGCLYLALKLFGETGE